MKKRILACLLALVMLIGVLPVMALAENNVVTPEGFAEAVKNAKDGDTITLGEGTFTLYGEDGIAGGKSLTFVGAGKDKTIWNIGTGETDVRGQGNADFSLRGAQTVTFRNMTLKAGITNGTQVTRDYMGFAHTDVTVVEDCVIDGKTFYWGYTSATFTNTTFACPQGDYALWTYTAPTITFNHCEFYSSGKVVNVYTDYGAGKYDITVNFKDCTVHSTNLESKSFLNINDANMGGYEYILNFTGINTVDGIKADGIQATEGSHREYNKARKDVTCSKLFEFNTKYDSDTNKANSGRTVVNIDGKTVWENGEMVSHSVDTTNDKYTDGYKDNAFDILEATEWAPHDGSYKRTVTRKCKYCGYTETVVETKRDDIDDITAVLLPALQANTDDHYSYLIGYADGTVRPNGKITRAEVATIFFRLLDDDTRAKYWSSKNDFSDVSADKWYNNAVSTLSNMGVIGGYADGTFRPDAPISRAEFAKIAVSFTQNNGSAVYNYFTDVKTTDWFAPYVTAAKDAGLIEGYSDGSFKPESKITRAEACAIVNRTLGRKPSKAHMKISGRIDWPDVQTTDWFYEAIMEATNSHTCTMGDRVETWTGKLPQRDWATLETGWANAYTGR